MSLVVVGMLLIWLLIYLDLPVDRDEAAPSRHPAHPILILCTFLKLIVLVRNGHPLNFGMTWPKQDIS